ncbi:methyl-accepting chemotaxis protein [Kineosporia sp. NBRC 101731]|uniref:methyl-accepting chemotaxis protein n=1 Tax=Kineosporia sp. NBRC 101731 TaxID=3032199 RepID=UPI002552FF29|nr:methyl-accepting chemotaxis protein [Kineosporia sp. NBRC 101731]
MAAVGLQGTSSQEDAGQQLARTSNGMSLQWNADMLHDGIRGDVLAALLAETAADRELLDTAAVTDDAAAILSRFNEAAALAPSNVAAQFAAVRPDLEKYADQAVSLSQLAESDPTAARAELPAFLTLFAQLEESMGGVDEAMLAAVDDSQVQAQASARQAKIWLLIGVIASILMFAVLCWMVGRSVIRPLRRVMVALHSMAERDLTARVATEGKDEFAQMGVAFNQAMTEISETISAAGAATGTLIGACAELSDTSVRLGQSAEATAAKAEETSSAATFVGTQIAGMSSATMQMQSAIREIAGQTASAVEVAAEAVREAQITSQSVADLTAASEEIGAIVKAITTIAEQTNLLALNATIEAARAGEAGTGFAVVASEVKDLAHETGGATEDITAKIAAIQSITQRSSDAIDTIVGVIRRIDENQSMIAAAVEEQSATTAEISRSVDEVADGATQISRNTAGIQETVQETSAIAVRNRASATELDGIARQVDGLISRFRC